MEGVFVGMKLGTYLPTLTHADAVGKAQPGCAALRISQWSWQVRCVAHLPSPQESCLHSCDVLNDDTAA